MADVQIQANGGSHSLQQPKGQSLPSASRTSPPPPPLPDSSYQVLILLTRSCWAISAVQAPAGGPGGRSSSLGVGGRARGHPGFSNPHVCSLTPAFLSQPHGSHVSSTAQARSPGTAWTPLASAPIPCTQSISRFPVKPEAGYFWPCPNPRSRLAAPCMSDVPLTVALPLPPGHLRHSSETCPASVLAPETLAHPSRALRSQLCPTEPSGQRGVSVCALSSTVATSTRGY